MTKPIPHVFKVKDVKAAARKAYKEERLAAQQGKHCEYFGKKPYGSCVCAIGAAIPRRLAPKIFNHDVNTDSIDELLKSFPQNFKVASTKGLKTLDNIQNTHDTWAIAVANKHSDADIEQKRAAFLATLK